MRLLLVASLLVACGARRSEVEAPAPSPPADDVAEAEDVEEVAPDDGTSAGDLYACKRVAPDREVVVTIKPNASLQDLVVWYLGATCAKVVFLVELEDRTRAAGVDGERMLGADLDARFDAYLADMGLVALHGDHDLVLIVEQAWADQGPVIMKVARLLGGAADAQADAIADDATVDALPLDEIVAVDDTHHRVPRTLLDKLMSDPSVMRGARIVPSVKNGNPNGFKLYAVRPESIFARLGFANGDTIVEVNGAPILTFDDGLRAYTAGREQDRLEIAIVRRGTPMTLVIEITD